MNTQEETISEVERKERVEHTEMIMHIRAILNDKHGRKFFKYLLKELSFPSVPEIGMEGVMLHDYIGYLRAGKSVFELLSEADHSIAGNILSQLEKERYEILYGKPKI